jgi:DNA repair photolyase
MHSCCNKSSLARALIPTPLPLEMESLPEKKIQFKVEKDRILVPVGEACPFGCKYCYTRGREVVPAKVDAEEILRQCQDFTQNAQFSTIQFGYDGDPFARPERGLAMIKRLATMGKHVNFSTKAALEVSTLEALETLQRQMEAHGTTLSALVSLSCWHSAPVVEPHTPLPGERMLTVTNLQQRGIPVFIAVRPILPHLADLEYERIAVEGISAGCQGFILGPLYADDRGQFARFIPAETLATVPKHRMVVPWSAHAPTWTRYEDTERLQWLAAMVEQKGGRVFLSSADAMKLVGQERKITWSR